MASTFNIQYAPGYNPSTGSFATTGSTGGGGSSPYSYNVYPGAQGGSGLGAVPGPIGLPNPASDLGAVYPNLSGTTGKVSQNILGELSGQLSPETLNNISNAAASYGVSSGMPLSGLSRNAQLESLGLTTEGLQRQGLGDFLSATPVISQTQTVPPALQAEIASRNANMAAAPNPTTVEQQLESLYQNQANRIAPTTAGRATASLGPAVPGQGNPPNLTASSIGPATAVGPVGGTNSPLSPTWPTGYGTGSPAMFTPGSGGGDLYGNTSPVDYYPNNPFAGAAGGVQFLDANGNPMAAPPAGSGNAAPTPSDWESSLYTGPDYGTAAQTVSSGGPLDDLANAYQ